MNQSFYTLAGRRGSPLNLPANLDPGLWNLGHILVLDLDQKVDPRDGREIEFRLTQELPDGYQMGRQLCLGLDNALRRGRICPVMTHTSSPKQSPAVHKKPKYLHFDVPRSRATFQQSDRPET